MFERQPIGDGFTWMHSDQIGAPQANGASGSNGQLLTLLDACLVSGFNIQTVTSVDISGSQITLNFGLNHGYLPRQKITISGSDDPLLNGSHRIIKATSNTATINVSGVTITTGVVKTKVSPLGFESIFGDSKPLERAYRSKDTSSTRTVMYLNMELPPGHSPQPEADRVKSAMVTLCSDMQVLGVPINSHTEGLNDYENNPSGSLFWHQARGFIKGLEVNEPEDSSWVIVGNGRYFYLFYRWQTQITDSHNRDFYAFGDITSLSSEDLNCCIWAGSISADDNVNNGLASNGSKIGNNTNEARIGFFIRSHDGVSGSQDFSVTAGLHNLMESGNPQSIAMPQINIYTQSMITMPCYAITTAGIRALLPRLMIIPSVTEASLDLNIADETLIVTTQAILPGAPQSTGAYAIDLGD